LQELITEFLARKIFAVIGASDKQHKYGYQIFYNLISRGYEVYPVNPGIDKIEGNQCYARIEDVPARIEVADFVVPPTVTEEVLKDCKRLGIDRIWLQPGAESDAAIEFCHANNMKVIYGVCVMTK
jgi:predicted CoA-binding protein